MFTVSIIIFLNRYYVGQYDTPYATCIVTIVDFITVLSTNTVNSGFLVSKINIDECFNIVGIIGIGLYHNSSLT